MARMRIPLPESDEGTVVLGQSRRRHERGDRDIAQARENLDLERGRVRALAIPCSDGSLVCGVLGAPELGCLSAVRGIALLCAERGEYQAGVLTPAAGVLLPTSFATVLAVAVASAGQLGATVAASVGQHRHYAARLALVPLWLSLIPRGLPVAAGQRRQVWQPRRGATTRVSHPLHGWLGFGYSMTCSPGRSIGWSESASRLLSFPRAPARWQ